MVSMPVFSQAVVVFIVDENNLDKYFAYRMLILMKFSINLALKDMLTHFF